jgi:hypothetical protein
MKRGQFCIRSAYVAIVLFNLTMTYDCLICVSVVRERVAVFIIRPYNLSLPGFDLRPGHVGFVVDKVAMGQGFSMYFTLPCQFSFHQVIHIQWSYGDCRHYAYSLNTDSVVRLQTLNR